jgi:hypothetical protein
MVSTPKCSPNSVCSRVAAVLSACFWSMDRSRRTCAARETGLSVMVYSDRSAQRRWCWWCRGICVAGQRDVYQGDEDGYLDQRTDDASECLSGGGTVCGDGDGDGEFEVVARSGKGQGGGALVAQAECRAEQIAAAPHDREVGHHVEVARVLGVRGPPERAVPVQQGTAVIRREQPFVRCRIRMTGPWPSSPRGRRCRPLNSS